MTDHDDRKDQTCTMCCSGRYQETTFFDDMDGVLHCTNKECNHEAKRYKWKDNLPLKPEKVKLSSQAQAVKDAALSMYADCNVRKMAWPLDMPVVTAALRAAADQAVPIDRGSRRQCNIRAKLLTIAAELEAQS